jgi:lysophospholipase L1-like esterase
VKTKRIICLLIITNILSLITLFMVLNDFKLPKKLIKSVGLSVSSLADANYRSPDNSKFEGRRSIFKAYKPKKFKIVMLGDSMTYGVDWNELFSRSDVANRGIAGDLTEGFMRRLSDIYELNPDVCMIMGGINDINKDIPVSDIFLNFTKIIEELQANKITPIIQSTLFVSTRRTNWKEKNEKVNELNSMLMDYAKANDISFIDINKELASNGALDSSYTYDGIHLVGNGYEKWRDLVLPKLQQTLITNSSNNK